jgi:regulator of sigma E protease
MNYFLAGAGIVLLIALHELGHMIAAKAVGMRVERYAVFFPPFIARVKKGETEYALGVIPLGGYAKITGMNPEEELPPDIAPRAYYNKPVWQRIVVIMAGPGTNLLIAFVLLFGLSFGAARPTATVAQVLPKAPASGVLEPGDRIVAVDGFRGEGKNTEDRLLEFQRRISSHHCAGAPKPGCRATTPAVLLVERGGRLITLRVRPIYSAQVRRTRIGFQFGSKPLHPDVLEAANTSVNLMWAVTKGTIRAIVGIFDPEKRRQISGVVGTYEVTKQAFSFSLRDALTVLAIISLSLAIINLFPFLPLDGGHVAVGLFEKIRGRRPSYRALEQISVFGFMLVAFLFIVGLSNDIGRLTGGGFNTR